MAGEKEKKIEQDENIQQNQENNEEADGLVFNEREHMVILLNNDNTAMEAVFDVLQNVFQLNQAIAMDRLMSAHENGGAICHINTQEECNRKMQEAEAYCQARGHVMHPQMAGRSMYYDELQFEVRVRN